MQAWSEPRRWARTGWWLLLPVAFLDWFSLVPQAVFVVAFVVAVLGMLGIGAALVARMLVGSRTAMALLGVALLLGGLVVFALDPFPGAVPALDGWWPAAVTQPQHVGSAYWKTAGLGIELSGFGMLATLLFVTLTGVGRPPRPGLRSAR